MTGAPKPVVVVVMGVAGAGKTTVAKALAGRCGYAFVDGDALHPKANIAKMASGHPLDDADRAPWLAAVGGWIDARLTEGRCGVVSCSALKRKYRDQLAEGRAGVRLVLLSGSRELIGRRMRARQGHFMPPELLDSQFADLEPPAADEHVVIVDVEPPVEVLVDEIVAALGLRPGSRPAAPGDGG